MTPSTKTVTKFLMAATQMSIWEMVEIKDLAVGIFNQDLRMHLPGVFDDDQFLLATTLDGFFTDGLADFDVLEADVS